MKVGSRRPTTCEPHPLCGSRNRATGGAAGDARDGSRGRPGLDKDRSGRRRDAGPAPGSSPAPWPNSPIDSPNRTALRSSGHWFGMPNACPRANCAGPHWSPSPPPRGPPQRWLSVRKTQTRRPGESRLRRLPDHDVPPWGRHDRAAGHPADRTGQDAREGPADGSVAADEDLPLCGTHHRHIHDPGFSHQVHQSDGKKAVQFRCLV